MALILLVLLLLSSTIMMLTKRSRKNMLVFGLSLSLVTFWLLMLIYIAKKGGIAAEMQTLLYGTRGIRLHLQYLMFTLQQMGYLMAIGRFLFPLFLIWIAMHDCKRVRVYGERRPFIAAAVLPVLSLIVYYPKVFEWIIGLHRGMIVVLVYASMAWIAVYLLAALGLILLELHDISMNFYRRRYMGSVVMLFSLAVLYALYAPQDPAQVYLFYRNEYMGAVQGLWYLSPALNMTNYILVFVLVILCSGMSIYTQLRYAHVNLLEGQQEIAIQRKFDAASKGASVFVHSVKNQLLANRVLLKREEAALNAEVLDREQLLAYHRQFVQNNAYMIDRMEELYKGIRTNAIVLVPENLMEVCGLAENRLKKKYPEARVVFRDCEDISILCDKNHFSEMLYNLLLNGWEAQQQTDRAELPITVYAHQERMWTVLEISDQGMGISKAQLRHIFDPFWSSKNTNLNWGMGLYYVRNIVKSHLGVLRIDTVLGKGTTFLIQIPRYTSQQTQNTATKKEAADRGNQTADR